MDDQQPTPADAKARRLVRTSDGRVGRLLYAPAVTRRDRTRARVLIDGRHENIEAATLTLVAEDALAR